MIENIEAIYINPRWKRSEVGDYLTGPPEEQKKSAKKTKKSDSKDSESEDSDDAEYKERKLRS